ncbi:type VI secretion system lipoprotein TssJ [Paraburkholderia fungorum]|uniref:Type VI secretion system lipoprotein TssJ n=1 Tax=Paraburkholderia fungorum TaxID=134537 RepID=A0AAP5QAV8_9BURK|nr:type VI secretion system lipoprotein TssJ [Paraburkholderia fungorum]MDT8840353.1 type VI secretion system lipoprotein TssJ [Paraburkholderia fungorum]
MSNHLTRANLAVLASCVLLTACGAWQTVSDGTSSAYHAVFYKQVKTLNVDLTARASLNPDETNRSTSVAVRVYQLKDRKLFDAASYDDLLKNDRTVLAQDLQTSIATVVNPGASASLSQPMQADTRYIAIVAFYRDPGADGAWRRVVAKKDLSADLPLKLDLVNRELVASNDVAKERPVQ